MAPRSMPATLAAFLCVFVLGTTSARSQNFEGPGSLRFGVFGQAGFFDSKSRDPLQVDSDVDGDLTKGGLGASFGYDWRMDRFMVGVEADVSTINGDVASIGASEVSLDYLSTFRARFGAYARPGILLYGTAGAAVLNTQLERVGNRKQGNFASGWVAGAGIEVDWHDMIWFAEYLHADFGEERLKSDDERITFESSANVARVGLKFKIGYDY